MVCESSPAGAFLSAQLWTPSRTPPRHRLRFAMQLRIPKYAQQSVRFGWDLMTGNGPWTDTVVTVYP